MSDANMENLSSAMDGELSKEELRFLLRRLDHDTSLLQVWTRYHVAGDSLRQQLPPLAGAGFASRVMQLIEDEQTAASQVASHRRDWLRLSVGGAIAASVAVAALMVSQPTARDSGHSAHLASVNPAPQAEPRAVADVQRPVSSALSAVPPSLSAYSASSLSQQASATLSDPSDNLLFQRYPIAGQGYSIKGYKALNNQDGSYLLLIDTPQAKAAPQRAANQGAAGR
ncbi:anti-anti-sigma factor [Dyella dinghuensis]|uniref:Anti-anti-sigma factor n=1 Tax=Dyella dinghuensis TaxID=1920169 RepID=A0A3S0Q021_9GAMM|nr:sigma-E factor negative regulatory protein [Dyella dinghuensis]RUL66108.1 anti-anti-sigma factor [Dyella dinghuensis]